MEILKPELIWINKRCYRVNPCHKNLNSIKDSTAQNPKVYEEDDLYSDDNDEEESREFICKNGQFETSIHIPSMFFSHIIGSKGFTKKRIESETKTRIIVPKQGTQGDVTVIGKEKKNVSSACRKLDLVVLASRSKIPSTHFIDIPFNNPTIKYTYLKFKNDILSSADLLTFDENFFTQPEKLHLTITVLSLVDNQDRLTAAQILNECRETLIDPILGENKEIYLHLKGLEIMNDDPSSVDTLYGVVKSEPLQQIANGILDVFCRNNLAQRKTENVKLHVTLINSKFNQNDDSDNEKRISFDARKILVNYRDYDFGIQKLEEIHLSQRFSSSQDGFYEATAILKL